MLRYNSRILINTNVNNSSSVSEKTVLCGGGHIDCFRNDTRARVAEELVLEEQTIFFLMNYPFLIWTSMSNLVLPLIVFRVGQHFQYCSFEKPFFCHNIISFWRVPQRHYIALLDYQKFKNKSGSPRRDRWLSAICCASGRVLILINMEKNRITTYFQFLTIHEI